jgi:aspartate-semialdehyde dehydrogenase
MPSVHTRHRLRRSPPAVAIVGATGAVGMELLAVLAERDFPVADLRLFASPRSAGKTLRFRSRHPRPGGRSERLCWH